MNHKFLFATIFFLIISCSKQVEFQLKNGILFENITYISADRNERISQEPGYVLTDVGKIIYVGKKRPQITGNFRSISGSNKFLSPGLIDSHVHLANVAGLNRKQQRENQKLVQAYYQQLPKSFLYFGFTTLIDANNYAPQRIKQLREAAVGPDIYTFGEMIQVMNDFTMEMDELSQTERYQTNFLYDPYNQQLQIPDSIDLAPHTAKRIVADLIRGQQNIGIKILYEDESSGLPVTWMQPSLELIKDLVSESHHYNVPFMIHAPSYHAQKIAIEAGVDIIAHAMWNLTAEPEHFLDTILTTAHQDFLTEIAKKRIAYQPTFRTILAEADIVSNQFLDDPELGHVYPQALIEFLKSDGDWIRKRIVNRPNFIKRVNPSLYQAIRAHFNSDSEMVNRLYDFYNVKLTKITRFLAERNANLLLGSDGVALNMYSNPPGYNGFLEMKHWYNAGVKLDRIFLAATINNAVAVHLDDRYGSIETGKLANLLVLNSNPLNDINAYNDIDYVIVHGKAYKRNELAADKNQD
ncbi:MAG: amidohydrolase family protein [Calditrichaeota bacterium]|nr:amidohydrolase family protein [Calditrichota bacterium]